MAVWIDRIIRRWTAGEDGAAAAEFALVFPVLFTMILGVWDVGNAVMVNQKAIAAGQIVIDLIGRQDSVSNDELAQAMQAGTLAVMPFDTSSLLIDVASIEYDSNDDPQVVWQEDSGGGAGDSGLAGKAIGLGVDGDNALAVQVTYQYTPLFAGQVIGTINMQERVFSRGRNGSLVTRE